MSPTELEARRWQAALDAVRGRNEFWVSIVHQDGITKIMLNVGRATSESLAAWREIQGTVPIPLTCTTAEWVEMLAQGSK